MNKYIIQQQSSFITREHATLRGSSSSQPAASQGPAEFCVAFPAFTVGANNHY
jgi:hypothetical protein